MSQPAAEIQGGMEPLDDCVSSGEEIVARSPLQLFWRLFRRDRVALTGLAFIVLLLLVAIFAPLVVKIFGVPGPNTQDTTALDPNFGTPVGPSGAHPFGVDDLGRDVLSRVVYGARLALAVAIISPGLAVVIGVTVGMVAGFFRGSVDTILLRMMDIVLAFPI